MLAPLASPLVPDEMRDFSHAEGRALFRGRIVVAVGAMRTVILTKRYAIKLAGTWNRGRFRDWKYRWRNFLIGLLANFQEKEFWLERWPELCPVSLYTPGGFVLVMPRARPLTDAEWELFDYRGFVTRGDGYAEENFERHGGSEWDGNPPGPLSSLTGGSAEPAGLLVPAECKRDSFGVLNRRIVAVDYG